MEAAEAKVQRVLEGSRQFLIPHFQRPYSWRERQWHALWRDLVELVESPASEPHFLGSIVSAPARSVPEGVEKRLLIDGQQRLTTILIMLTLLRDRAHESGLGKLAEKANDYITNRHEEGLDQYKLLPTQGDGSADSDRDAFVTLVDRRPNDSSSGIKAAAAFFTAKLRRSDAPPLDELFRAITMRLTLVSIILDDKDNPHRIFESLNGTGRPLSQADLIRNFFFMRLPNAEHERVYRALWQPMQKRLGEERLSDFIRHYLTQFGTVVKESDVYTTLKARVDGGGPSALEQLQELETFSKHYEVLVDPSKAASAAVRERLDRLRRLEVTVAFPFLLPVYADFVAGTRTEPDLCAVLDIVETYVVRRFVCGVATHGLNKVFTPLYQQVRKGDDFLSALRTTLADRRCPRDPEFRARLGDAHLYGGGERREKTKLVLERLERAHGHKERVGVENLTIEHVMPQSLTDRWKEELGDDWEDDHDSLLHTLGNLTLTSYNSELSNDSFSEKRDRFADSHVELNRYFSRVEHWNAEEIGRRADALAERALTVWPYFGPAQTVEPDSEFESTRASGDVTGTLPHAVIFQGTRYPVRSWAEVLITTLECVAAAAPDNFVILETELTRVISRDPSSLRRNGRRRLLTNGASVEINLSAAQINRTCERAVLLAGIDPGEWSVEFDSARGDDDDDDDDDDARQGGPTSALKALQGEFWAEVRHALDASQQLSSLLPARAQHHYSLALGRSGFRILLIAAVQQGQVDVRLSIDHQRAADAVALLAADRVAIEGEIGAALDWGTESESRRRTIKATRPIVFEDRALWPEAIAWTVKTAIAFKMVFAPRVAALEL